MYINSLYGKFRLPDTPEPELVCQECMVRPYKHLCADCGKLICDHIDCCEMVIDELENKGQVPVCYSCITGSTPFANIDPQVRELINFIQEHMMP